MNQDKIREKAVQFQVLQNTLRGLEQNHKMITSDIEDVHRTRLALEDLENSKGDAYIPLGANNFVAGEIKDNEHVLVSIGSGIAVKKKRQEALEISEKNIKQLQKQADNIGKEIRKVTDNLMKLQTDIETLRK